MRKARDRLRTLASLKRSLDFATAYRAATMRRRYSGAFFNELFGGAAYKKVG